MWFAVFLEVRGDTQMMMEIPMGIDLSDAYNLAVRKALLSGIEMSFLFNEQKRTVSLEDAKKSFPDLVQSTLQDFDLLHRRLDHVEKESREDLKVLAHLAGINLKL